MLSVTDSLLDEGDRFVAQQLQHVAADIPRNSKHFQVCDLLIPQVRYQALTL